MWSVEVYNHKYIMSRAEFQSIAEVATAFQRRKVCDVGEVRHKLPGWTFDIHDPEYPEESDWSISKTVDVGGTEYYVTLWHDNPKRLHVNVSIPEHTYTYIGKRWSWSIYAEPLECYVSDCPGFDALPESTKTWLNELNHVFDGKE
jgi:hypothetical protein